MRILIADDHSTTREEIAALLRRERDLDVVGEASDGQMAVELAEKLLPDVVIMDVLMPEMDGIDATRQIVSEHPEIKVIGFSMHPESNIVSAMRRAGAVACVKKSDPVEVLIAAIHDCFP